MRTTPSPRPSYGPDPIADALAADRLSAPAVTYFSMSAAAPFTVVAGLIATAFAATGNTGLPAAFLVVGAVLTVFAIGYVAMARHAASAGAFYSFVARGLGRPVGVAAAWVALVGYNAMQIGLYGAFGAAAVPMLERSMGISLPWWVPALIAWAIVAILGVRRIDITGRVLAILCTAEVAVILVMDVTGVFHPGGVDMALDTLSLAAVPGPGSGALLLIALVGFVGFESSVNFSEEARNVRRTIPIATYSSIAIIAGLYALSAWALTVAAGTGNVVKDARLYGADTYFVVIGAHLNGVVVDVARWLFLTSLLAAMVSYHSTTARYGFALGREGVLPAVFGQTFPRTGAPKVGSIAQSALGLIVIIMFASADLDPLVQLFYYGGTFGGLGVLLLIATTSLAIVVFFLRQPSGENVWRRIIAPVPALVALGAMVWLAVYHFATLLGVPPSDPLVSLLPPIYLCVAAMGLGWAQLLRYTQPTVYARIGMGAKAAIAPDRSSL